MTPRVTNQPRAAGDWTLGLTNQPRPQNLRVLLRPKITTHTEVWGTVHTEVFSLSREPKAKVVFRRKTTFALNDHKTSLIVRVWLRVHTEVYTEVKQLGPGGRREFDVSIFETTFETSVWSR